MIRINLLHVEHAQKKASSLFSPANRMAVLCGLIMLATAAFVGWRYLSLGKQSADLDAQLLAAEQEKVRINSVIQQVQQFDQRKAQLQQRVSLIEELRKGQSGPVHMLDQISRSLPPMLWLSEIKQGDAKAPNDVIIDGRCTSQTSVSDFVSNLEASGYFKGSIDIVSSTTEPLPQPPGELIKFQIRATFVPPLPAGTPPAPAKPGTAKPGV
jgi:type IV pilus assembly protein PilN